MQREEFLDRLHQLRRARWLKYTLIVLLVLLLLRVNLLTYSGPTEIGIARNVLTGQTWPMPKGLRFKPPWVLVPHIDTRPMRVSVDSAGHGWSAKLVQFVPSEWESFVKTEGFYFWWWANRISFNSGYRDEHRGIKDIFRGYAYGVKQYPFLVVLKDVDQE